MRYFVKNFILNIEKKSEKISFEYEKKGKIESGFKKISIPLKISNSSKIEEYALVDKTRDFMIFESLDFLDETDNKYYRVIQNIYDFIEFIELLKAFNNKKLDIDETYEIGEVYEAKIVQKNNIKYLKITFFNYENDLFLNRLDCATLASIFSKILNKIEIEADYEED